MWKSELAQLRNRLTHAAVLPDRFYLTPVAPRLASQPAEDPADSRRQSQFAALTEWSDSRKVDRICLDADDTVTMDAIYARDI